MSGSNGNGRGAPYPGGPALSARRHGWARPRGRCAAVAGRRSVILGGERHGDEGEERDEVDSHAGDLGLGW